MKRVYYTPYLVLTGFLLSLMSMSEERADKFRSFTVGMVSPFWDAVHSSKIWLAAAVRTSSAHSLEAERLRLENQMLRLQVEKMGEWLLFEERIDEQWERLRAMGKQKEGDHFWKEFFQRRSEHLAERLDLQSRSLPARVIFREPGSF